MTFAEAVRRRTFVVLALFAAIILLLTPLLPTDGTAPGRIRLIISVCSMTTSVVSMLVVLLVGASSLAAEIESKRIYWPATKPVRRSTYLAGKYLGVLLVGAALVGAMGVGTAVFVRIVAWKMDSGGELSRGVMTSRAPRLPERIGELHVQDLLRADRSKGSEEIREMEMAEFVPRGEPLVYVFRAPDSVRREGEARFRMKAFSGIKPTFLIALKVRNPRTGEWEGGRLRVTGGMSTDITAPAAMISPDGVIEVRVENLEPEPVRLRRADGLYLAEPAGPFEWNLLGSLSGGIDAAVVGGSAFLSFPVTTFAGAAVWLGGYLSGFALRIVTHGRGIMGSRGEVSAAEEFLGSLIEWVCRALPDFAGFSASRELADSQAIGVTLILWAVLWLVMVRGGIFAAASLAMYSRRELGD